MSTRRREVRFAALAVLVMANPAMAGVIFNFTGNTLGGGSRWDAAARTINGLERSLDGGLRFSMQGGSFQAFRDLFSWNAVPTVTAFTQAVTQAFDAWASVDPATNLTTALDFVPDLATAVAGSNTGNGGLNTLGAEIDLFASNDAFFWDAGNNGLQGETSFGDISSPVTLTSGTAGYAGSRAISGADIIINNNAGAVYDLDIFRRLLTHEIGHALGLGDVEGDINPGAFIDDNFNGTNSATALATLNNSWALLVNPLNPGASAGLARYTVPFGDPGTTTAGVNILMESRGLGLAAGNPVTNLIPLTNDDYGTRQFLYPSLSAVPEPSTIAVVAGPLLAAALVAHRRRRRQ